LLLDATATVNRRKSRCPAIGNLRWNVRPLRQPANREIGVPGNMPIIRPLLQDSLGPAQLSRRSLC